MLCVMVFQRNEKSLRLLTKNARIMICLLKLFYFLFINYCTEWTLVPLVPETPAVNIAFNAETWVRLKYEVLIDNELDVISYRSKMRFLSRSLLVFLLISVLFFFLPQNYFHEELDSVNFLESTKTLTDNLSLWKWPVVSRFNTS